MAVSPGTAGNWRAAMLYGDLLELRITLVFDDPNVRLRPAVFTLDMLNMSIFRWEESDADPASIEPVRGTCAPSAPERRRRDQRAPPRRATDADARVECGGRARHRSPL